MKKILTVAILSLFIFSCSSTIKYVVTYQVEKENIIITQNGVYSTGTRIKDFESFEEMRMFLKGSADNCVILFYKKL